MSGIEIGNLESLHTLVFSSLEFLFRYLPLFLILFYAVPKRFQMFVLFAFSLILYALGDPAHVPMLIGFGCSVPAIMATRTLSSERDHKMTVLLTPFMSCSAKLPIYAMFTAAFFPEHPALVMICLYAGGMAVGVLCGLVLKNTAFHGKPVPFVMELPNYRLPGPKNVALLLWDKAKDFLTRAFTVIFLATIVIWFLQTFDTRLNVVAAGGGGTLH